jgi:hypothetical protein
MRYLNLFKIFEFNEYGLKELDKLQSNWQDDLLEQKTHENFLSKLEKQKSDTVRDASKTTIYFEFQQLLNHSWQPG